MLNNVFPYEWYLKNGYPQSKDKSVTPNDYKVFGTFINGGGSTMGYKLAGFTHLGGVEIDSKTATCYKRNHNPKHLFIQDIREFNARNDLPQELYNLDILDGSPPCTTFSTAGKREKSFGIKKKFAEGDTLQTLDDLLFIYAETIKKLQPKTFVMENVSGLIKGGAQVYIKRFLSLLPNYNMQIFLLNGADMGLPQSRERVFVIGHKRAYNLPKLQLDFKEKHIPFEVISDDSDTQVSISQKFITYWNNARYNDAVGTFMARVKIHPKKPARTITTTSHYHYKYKRTLNKKEIMLASSFPLDYEFSGHSYQFYCGMCVPPLMIANIALQIKMQWLDNIKV